MVDEHKILLEKLGAEHMKIIADVYDGSIFSLDNPIVLKRSVKIKYSGANFKSSQNSEVRIQN